MSAFDQSPGLSETQEFTTIIVFGASGDLARKKTFPSLFQLFRSNLLPRRTRIVGYARTVMTHDQFYSKATSNIKGSSAEITEFMKLCSYISGSYNQNEDFLRLRKAPHKVDYVVGSKISRRLRVYYMALPPSAFLMVSEKIKTNVYDDKVDNHLVIEKPFGFDQETSRELNSHLSVYFKESEIFRTDHYLGKEMVKNIMVLRFANTFYEASWNNKFISNVQLTFREPFGTEGRGGYFDQFGIIRDVMQNHLLQVLSVLAMEPPKSLDAEHIRDRKTEVLKHIPPVVLEETLLGQYTKSTDGTKPGYLDDETVNPNSNTPTFAATVLHINNDRWRGVPFIMKAGKAVESAKVVIRIQFKDESNNLFPKLARNELVIQISPKENIYLKTVVKEPGLSSDIIMTDLDLSYIHRFSDVLIPDAYASLLLDVIGSDHSNFVREDELDEAWRIFTPILKRIDEGNVKPLPYAYGTRGPQGASDFHIKFGGYKPTGLAYDWSQPGTSELEKPMRTKLKSAKKVVKRLKPKLDTLFDCLFCNHEKSVNVSIDRNSKIGTLSCKVCQVNYQTVTNNLSVAIDIYSEWIDACEEAKKQESGNTLAEYERESEQQDSDREDYQRENIQEGSEEERYDYFGEGTDSDNDQRTKRSRLQDSDDDE
ncbi:hypothetical protein BB558_003529 [Smittium angustum]|uniref:Glucose-6-phosphate 1-dehydrogenase n=1 Tax=Smittium angustum TaxID=133377 RepID=A0A2U1J5S5_SMIAN|nr:hypothetical protein BB558_003529 [Smittium angustum]